MQVILKNQFGNVRALLRGAWAAIKSVEANILETYLGSCVTNAFNSDYEKDKKQKIEELKDLFNRFE